MYLLVSFIILSQLSIVSPFDILATLMSADWLILKFYLLKCLTFILKKGERNGEEFNFEFCVDQTLDEGSSLNGEGGRESGRDLLRRRRRMGVTCRVGDTCRGANMQVAFSSGYGIEVKEAGC